ncbi:zinc-dependent alcohol dehydrogenase family protein [Caldimonas sp. KR1-144]|uniref:zinc-dependent alcohol dehydrogenase family protein n=1 Tax=Caldimonas sp. KR1-144 TaxID=3400911 RepID=UPI003BFD570F
MPPDYAAWARVEGSTRLAPLRLPMAPLAEGQLRLKVLACGVCRTDLHLLDGDLPPRGLPRVPGHEIVGRVVERAPGAQRHALGTRVGVPWLGGTCGHCLQCRGARENLCENASFTGWSVDGGYAEYAVAHEDFCFELPPGYGDEEAAPLLCAGLIGYRAWRMLPPHAKAVGLYGFGAAAHLIAQVALAEGRRVFAFTRPGDAAAQALARRLGAHWAGDSTQAAPSALDGAILFAPDGRLVPQALGQLAPAGGVVCAGIHMSDIPGFAYRTLWQERSIRSVANLTRQDAIDFLALAARHKLTLATTSYPLAEANRALDDLRGGAVTGAAVLRV